MYRNFVGREVVRLGALPTLETFCEQQWLLENEATGRWMEIYKKFTNYKRKNTKCVKLDNLLLSYVRKYDRGNLSDDEYFDLCNNAIRKGWSPYEEK